MTITPAYGRDYKSKAGVLGDWLAGKDFIIQPSVQYINRQDAETDRLHHSRITSLTVRYNSLRDVRIISRKGDTWTIN